MSSPIKNSHCSYCGTKFDARAWPRTCGSCSQISYVNPLPVAVGLIPVMHDGLLLGLLLTRRNIHPGFGELALPGGYMEMGETWQQGIARELVEETNIVISPDSLELFEAGTSDHGQILIFGVSAPITTQQTKVFRPNSETQALSISEKPVELAFPLHTKAANRWYAENLRNVRFVPTR